MTVIGKVTLQFKLEFELGLICEACFLKKSVPIDLAEDIFFRRQNFAKAIIATSFGTIRNALPCKLGTISNNRVATGR